MKKITIITLLFYLISNSYGASPVINTTKATAQLAATCSISANNLSWGGLILPLTTQGASSNIQVLCNKGASFTIGLAYGGIYGTTSAGSDYWRQDVGNPCVGFGAAYLHYNPDGTYLGRQCQIYIPNFYTFIDATINGQARKYVSSVPFQYNYGIMSGLGKGDKIAYAITVPGDSSKIWNTGNNSYTSTGTGSSQNIIVNANLVPAQSGNQYPTPDMYMDTVTATINF